MQFYAANAHDHARDESPPKHPQRVGEYEILGVAGVGGMGVVYKARHPSLTRRLAALKVLRPESAASRIQRRFEREGEALSRLQHPGVAVLYETGWWTDDSGRRRPFLAMEHVQGLPLTTDAVRRRLPLPERIERFLEVCDAVEHAHRRGVVHRDLKPSNILVTEEGRVKVLDFGVARLVEGDRRPGDTLHTRSGEIVGTLRYMSPEQIDADPRTIDHRTDVYALGVLLFELLADRLPYEIDDRSILHAARTIREDPPTRLGSVSRALRGDLEIIVGAALEKSPTRRYQSARELAADLRRHLRNEPIAARAPSLSYQLSKFARRNRALTTGVCAAFAALTLGLAAAAHQAIEARRAHREAEARFNDVRDLTGALIFDLHDAVADLPGAEGARAMLAEQGMVFLARLRDSKPDDAALLMDLAEAYTRLGDAVGRSHGANLGDYDAAQRAYNKGLETLDALPAPIARTADALALRSGLLRRVQVSVEDHEAQRDQKLDALALSREALSLRPDDPDLATELIESLYRAGIAMHYTQEHERMIALLDEALAVADRWVSRRPAHEALAEQQAEAAFWRAEMPRFSGLGGQRERFERAKALAMQLYERRPSDAARTHKLLRARSALTTMLAEDGDRDGALAEIERLHALHLRRVDAAPSDQEAFRSLDVFCGRAGETLMGLGLDEARPIDQRREDLHAAIDWFQRANDLTRRRQERGWLFQWEGDYLQQGQELIDRCEEALAALE